MKRFTSLLGILFLVPTIAFAQNDAQSAAGFATQSVFLSTQSPVAGESILIYASMANAADAAFSGTVAFTDADAVVGSVPISLDAGIAKTVSVPWTPKSGSHTIVAELKRADDSIVAKESATFSIAQPAPTISSTAIANGAVESSAPIQQQITDMSPQAAAITAPVLSTIDSFRAKTAGLIDSQLTATKQKLPGASGTGKSTGTSSSLATIGWTGYFYVLSVLRSIFGSIAFFYLTIMVLFFFLMYQIYRRMRRPKYSFE